MGKQRRTYTAAEKVSILRRHLLEKVPVSDVCDEYGLNPNVFYRWQKEFFEHGAAAFESRKGGSGRERQLARKVDVLTAKLSHKDAVIAEVVADHILLKKSLGEG